MNTLQNHTQETFMNPTEKLPVLLLGFNESWKKEEVNGDEVELPEDWSVRTLGESFEISGGGTPPTHDPSYWGGEIVWVGPKYMGDDIRFVDVKKKDMKTLTPQGASKVAAKPTPAGSLIVSSRAPVGYANIAPCDLYTNQGCYSFVAGKGGDTSYLYFWIRKHRSLLQSRSSGTTFLEISRKAISLLEYAAPSLDEQTLIAQVLTTQESQIQDLRNLAAVERQRLSWLSDELLSGRLRVEMDEETPETVLAKSDRGQDAEERLPGVRIVANESWKTVDMNGKEVNIPGNWELSCLGKTSIIHGGIPAPKEFNKNGKPFIRVSSLHHKGTYVGKDHTKEYLNGNYKHVPKGTLLVAKSGESIHQNYRNLTSEDCIIVGHIAGIEAASGNSIEYIRFQLKNSPFERNLAQGGATPSISMKDLESVPVLMADPLEQIRIAQVLTAQENQVSDIEKLIEVEQKRLEWLSDELLRGRIRVKQASKE